MTQSSDFIAVFLFREAMRAQARTSVGPGETMTTTGDLIVDEVAERGWAKPSQPSQQPPAAA